jgi:hypothetical protein
MGASASILPSLRCVDVLAIMYLVVIRGVYYLTA